MNGTLTVFKLTSGEEIMGKVLEMDKEGISITLESPMRVERQPSMDGNILYTIRAWLIQQFENGKPEPIVNLNIDHIIAEMTPSEDVASQYHKTVEYFMEPIETPEYDFDNIDMGDSDGSENIIQPNFGAPKKLQ